MQDQMYATAYITGADWNDTRFFNPKFDQLTRSVQSETDKARRAAMIREATELHSADIGHIPLHQQALAWGMSKKVDMVQLADNFMPFKWITIKK